MKEFLKKTEKIYELCLIERNQREHGIDGEATLQQLSDVIIPEIKNLMKMVKENDLPPREKRYLRSFANAFTVWGWNMKTPTDLFVGLAELNREFKKL